MTTKTLKPNNPHYLLCIGKEFDNIHDAEEAIMEIHQLHPYMPKVRTTYYIPQPTYKAWVPNWLIRLIKL